MQEYKFYGKYKGVRNAAWHVLVDFNVTTLPVSALAIIKAMDITAASYSEGQDLIHYWNLSEHCNGNDAFTALLGDKWYIFFDDQLHPRTKIRIALAHELGHIFLGHDVTIKVAAKDTPDPVVDGTVKARKKPIETEADMFALRLLAPDCVLWGLNIREPDDITALCGVCIPEARKRAERMAILYERQKFLADPLEKKLFEQFRGYIEEMKRRY